MINDFIVVIGFILFLLQKMFETIPPRLLEVTKLNIFTKSWMFKFERLFFGKASGNTWYPS